jgi:Domain of unknown function (DUF4331)
MTMRRLKSVATLILALLALTSNNLRHQVVASSHRDAPLTSLDPMADNTDVYAFRSPDKPSTVTLVADYIPLEEPAAELITYRFDDTVLYEIHVDNTGDGKPDITYQFRFTTKIRNPNTFLYTTGPIRSLNDPNWNIRQYYTVTRVENGKSQVLGTNLVSPPVNIGPRSTPNYATLAAGGVHNLPDGIAVFAGQRDDPHFADLGSVFDLAGLRPFNPVNAIPLPIAPGVDGIAGFNVHSIVIQVPITQLTRDHKLPKGVLDPKAIIGVYASASRQRIRVLNPNGTVSNSGPFQQVSRLGNPLVNEVMTPIGKKDYWNSVNPWQDNQFLPIFLDPDIARRVSQLYPVMHTPPAPRKDLVSVILTGIPGLTYTGPVEADLLRLNMAQLPTAKVGQGNRLGLLGGDLAGFPNGRRLEDDVIDIMLRALVGGTIFTPAYNHAPNNTIGDGVDHNDVPFLPTFPYVGLPHSGYDDSHNLKVGSSGLKP